MRMDINQAAKRSVTMHVEIVGASRFRLRLFLVTQLLRIVSWIAPFRVDTEIKQ